MKNLTVIVFLTVLFSNIYSQNIIDKPFIKFDTTVYDFNKIPVGKTVTKTFYFVNKGNEPLLILNVQTTCGCTSSDWTKKPVQPNAKGYVKLEFKADKEGTFSKTAYVFCNAKNSPVELKIKGEAVKSLKSIQKRKVKAVKKVNKKL